jgi:hypothetical protein
MSGFGFRPYFNIQTAVIIGRCAGGCNGFFRDSFPQTKGSMAGDTCARKIFVLNRLSTA